ncbi:MAG: DUF4058 family protein [Planctomycetes bacterium]|nr:DUF4058 family protein [Planctomycetota bacterium]
MPVHDWTRVSAGTFHHFHCSWIVELARALNAGRLPADYYALAEQSAGETLPDVLTLREAGPLGNREGTPNGATAVAEAPPRVSVVATARLERARATRDKDTDDARATPDEEEVLAGRRKTLAIRHSAGDEIVAMVEILSPGNKNNRERLGKFLHKAYSALASGVHLLIVDLFPPGKYDAGGIHGAFWANFDDRPYQPPPDRPLTLASYEANSLPRAYVEPAAIGSALPEMPLFLAEGWYVNAPLDPTYGSAYLSVPERWRRVIEGREQPSR